MNPGTKTVEPKQMYCERLEETAVCGGIFTRTTLEATVRRHVLMILSVTAALSGAGLFAASAQEDPTKIVADQIRSQGYKCDSPRGATRDAQASRPDEQVWLLQCGNGSYRVRLVPDMAAKVEKIDKGQDGSR